MLLEVSLLKELFKEQISPLMRDVEWTALGGHVRRVHAELHELLLRVKLFGCRRVVYNFVCVEAFLDLARLYQ